MRETPFDNVKKKKKMLMLHSLLTRGHSATFLLGTSPANTTTIWSKHTYQMLRKSACFMYLNSKEKYIFLNHEISISLHLFYLPSNNKSDFWVLLLNSILEPCTVRHSYAQKQICVGREIWLFYSHCKFEATLYTQLPTLFTFLWLFKMSLSVF